MDSALFVSLVGFAFVAAITPGPNNLLLMSSGALFGLRRTVPHLVGIQIGFAILMVASVYGLGTLVAQWPVMINVVRVIGATWLLWLSSRFFRAAVQADRSEGRVEAIPIARPFRFLEAILFQWINPKAIVASVSSAGAYIAIADDAWQRAVIIAGVFATVGSVACTLWTIAGDSLSRCLARGDSATRANIGMGILIVATAALVLFG